MKMMDNVLSKLGHNLQDIGQRSDNLLMKIINVLNINIKFVS